MQIWYWTLSFCEFRKGTKFCWIMLLEVFSLVSRNNGISVRSTKFFTSSKTFRCSKLLVCNYKILDGVQAHCRGNISYKVIFLKMVSDWNFQWCWWVNQWWPNWSKPFSTSKTCQQHIICYVFRLKFAWPLSM